MIVIELKNRVCGLEFFKIFFACNQSRSADSRLLHHYIITTVLAFLLPRRPCAETTAKTASRLQIPKSSLFSIGKNRTITTTVF